MLDRNHPDRLISELAGDQHGIVSGAQLLGSGLTRGQIKHRIATGRLQIVHRGVFHVGAGGRSPKAEWSAAALAYGDRAAVTHRSAAQHSGLLAVTRIKPIHVTIPHGAHSRPGVRIHQAVLSPEYLTSMDGIPVTTVPRTIFDLGASEARWVVERALREAETKLPGIAAEVAAIVDDHPGHRGVRILRSVLGLDGLGRSELEIRFRRLLEQYELPPPRVNVVLTLGARRIEVDFLWLPQRLIAELDGRAFHDGTQAFEADRERDRLLQAAGWRVIRITWRQLHDHPAALARDLGRMLR